MHHPALRIVLVLLLVVGGAAALILQAAEREFRQGRQLVMARQWTEASRRFQKVMMLNPLDPRAPSARAVTLQQMRQGSEVAERLIQKASALDRMNAYYPLQLAEALLPDAQEAGVRQDVEHLLKHALELDPFHYPEAYRRLAQLHANQGRAEDAAAVYARAVALYSARPVFGDMVLRVRLWHRVAALFSEAASFHAARGRTDDAVRVLDTLLRQDPAWQPAYHQIADLYLRAGRNWEAYYTLVAGRAEMSDGVALSRWPPRLPLVLPRVSPR